MLFHRYFDAVCVVDVRCCSLIMNIMDYCMDSFHKNVTLFRGKSKPFLKASCYLASNAHSGCDVAKLSYFIFYLQPTESSGFNTLFIQYNSVICQPSDHTVGRPPRA